MGDQFAHAWFFNRFRIERLGDSYLLSLALSTETGGMLAVNGVVLGPADLLQNRERTLGYIAALSEVPTNKSCVLQSCPPPTRVYPINHLNLARTDDMAEIGCYRFSLHSIVDALRQTREKKSIKAAPVKCYPVVMFRSDLSVQLTLLKELFSP
jgi:hypothetical protein